MLWILLSSSGLCVELTAIVVLGQLACRRFEGTPSGAADAGDAGDAGRAGGPR